MSMWNNDQEDFAHQMNSILSGLKGDLDRERINPLNLAMLDTRARNNYGTALNLGNQNLINAMMRSISNAGRSASSQGFAMNLSNPYALKNVAEARAASAYTPQFGELNANLLNQMNSQLMQNPLIQKQSELSTQGQHWGLLMQLLGQRMGLGQQMSRGAVEWLPGAIQGAGQIAASLI